MKKIIFIILSSGIYLSSCTPPNLYRTGWMFRKVERKGIVRTAKKYLGVRYRNGGAKPSGFDCSGYVMYIYKRNGIYIPRTAEHQFYNGKRVSLRTAKPGDLVFFQTSGKRLSHVGIYLGNYRFIHSPKTGKRVSIANIRNSYWQKRYIGSVTYL